MNRLIKIVIVAGIGCTVGSSVFAATPLLDEREDRQHHRILQGVNSGELTRKESIRLVQGQRQLRRAEHRVKADGDVTRKERARLQHKANKESARIRHNKHDKRKQP
ncbi:MAG: hypothetical protein KUG75_16360 [Pseudomonadales bacterium]|nr:hypothetical protein [Pseudomonadales bacterium]